MGDHFEEEGEHMKVLVITALVAALYVCIGACAVKYGIKPTALMVLALILMGVLEGIL